MVRSRTGFKVRGGVKGGSGKQLDAPDCFTRFEGKMAGVFLEVNTGLKPCTGTVDGREKERGDCRMIDSVA